VVNRKTSEVIARREARERLARERAEQAVRDKSNEADLVEYLILEHRIETADIEYQATVANVRERRESAVTGWRHGQAECMRRMSDRGETIERISDRTGMSIKEVRRLTATSNSRSRNGRDGLEERTTHEQ